MRPPHGGLPFLLVVERNVNLCTALLNFLIELRRDRREAVFLFQQRVSCVSLTGIECQRLPPRALVTSSRGGGGWRYYGMCLPRGTN
jgi:hypothetical protein